MNSVQQSRPTVGQLVTFNKLNPRFHNARCVGIIYLDDMPHTTCLTVLISIDRVNVKLERCRVSTREIDVIQDV